MPFAITTMTPIVSTIEIALEARLSTLTWQNAEQQPDGESRRHRHRDEGRQGQGPRGQHCAAESGHPHRVARHHRNCLNLTNAVTPVNTIPRASPINKNTGPVWATASMPTPAK